MGDHHGLIQLDEYGAAIDVALPGEIVAELKQTELVRVTSRGRGRWRLTPRDRVGAVRVGDWEVSVAPKIGVAGMLFLLGYATNPGFRPEDVSAAESDELLPIMAESLARHAERAIGQGVLQGFAAVEITSPVLRGRLRAADHMARRTGFALPIEVTYDEYSPDIIENRILRSAIHRMMAVPRVGPEIRRRLAHVDRRLDGVNRWVVGDMSLEWVPARHNARYVPALRLAEVVLRHVSARPAPGELRVASFVVDMATVFQDFVATALRQAAGRLRGRIESQYGTHLTRDGGLKMQPDVVYLQDGVPRAVFDAKYKIERKTRGVPREDIYQMLAYCTVLKLRRGYIVYAKGQGDPVAHEIVNTDPPMEIVQHPLDLGRPPSDILEQIESLLHVAIGDSVSELTLR